MFVASVACSKKDGASEGSNAPKAGSAVAGSAATPPPTGSAAAGSAVAPAGSAAVATGSGSAAGSGAGSGSAADAPLAVGDKVMAKWTDGAWWPGKISKITDDGKYNILWEDGTSSNNLPAAKVKRRAAPKKGATGGCPSGLNMCSGKCVNEYTDRNNCFACGRVCPEGYECRGGSCSTPL